MKAIIDGITFLIETIKMLVDFLISMITGIVYLFQYLGTIMDIVTTFIATLPGWLISFGTISLTVSILYLTLGRNAGKNE